jgi:hypothetical protein
VAAVGLVEMRNPSRTAVSPATGDAPPVPINPDCDDWVGLFPYADPCTGRAESALSVAVTPALVVGPSAGVLIPGALGWGRVLSVVDVGLALEFYLVTGVGVTCAFRRRLTDATRVPSARLRTRRGHRTVGDKAGSVSAAVENSLTTLQEFIDHPDTSTGRGVATSPSPGPTTGYVTGNTATAGSLI